ncbi:hypothetical protein [Massilia sp. HP4]|uniref:hypothetical protein n=1 Tax=Massilia sp. HP4 TaxID=2562316 RepID=UPI0010BF8CED|nr:hypothetical protein [Massilia sp. HP4]
MLPVGDGLGKGVQALRMLPPWGSLRTEQAGSSKAAAASLALIDLLHMEWWVSLQLDRDGASARICRNSS